MDACQRRASGGVEDGGPVEVCDVDEHAAALPHIVLRRALPRDCRKTSDTRDPMGLARRRLAIPPASHERRPPRRGRPRAAEFGGSRHGRPGSGQRHFRGPRGGERFPLCESARLRRQSAGIDGNARGMECGPFPPLDRPDHDAPGARIAGGYFRGSPVRMPQRKSNDACLEAALFVYSSLLSRLWPMPRVRSARCLSAYEQASRPRGFDALLGF
ncbi:hypothetical protein MTO96_013813 [Rhipicephalus appendiculatus]